MPSQNLFVYGTLRRGSNNEFSRLLSAQAQFLGDGQIRGRLYKITWHPGAIPSDDPTDWVRGEVFRLEDTSQFLSTLDAYEGPGFERVEVTAHLDSGEQLQAWIYWYKGEQGTRIESGDWLDAPA